jgi:hypothetical protein
MRPTERSKVSGQPAVAEAFVAIGDQRLEDRMQFFAGREAGILSSSIRMPTRQQVTRGLRDFEHRSADPESSQNHRGSKLTD